jgi:hypothetical protein
MLRQTYVRMPCLESASTYAAKMEPVGNPLICLMQDSATLGIEMESNGEVWETNGGVRLGR